MMVMSFKLTKKKIIFGLILLAAIIAVVLIATSSKPEGSSNGSSSTPAVVNSAETPEQRLEFIAQFGWEVEPEPVQTLSIYIPRSFDEVLTRYNAIQKNQGYDLNAYSGKKAVRYTYSVTNYPEADGDVVINLLVYEGEVIGGDVCSKALGGFMHGFSPDRVTASVSEPVEAVTTDPTEPTAGVPGAEISAPTD